VEYDSTRRTPRYSLVVDIEVTDVQSEIQINGRTKELSLSGCGVDTLRLLPKGTSVRIRMSHRGAEVKAFARVVFSSADLGIGLAFTNIDGEDEYILEWWLAELKSISI
jgi:PilZ domain-containing protein